LIVGGGDVAERKARLLLEAGARLTVNALAFIPQFKVWADEGMLTLVEGPFDESLLNTCWLAIARTPDDARQVASPPMTMPSTKASAPPRSHVVSSATWSTRQKQPVLSCPPLSTARR